MIKIFFFSKKFLITLRSPLPSLHRFPPAAVAQCVARRTNFCDGWARALAPSRPTAPQTDASSRGTPTRCYPPCWRGSVFADCSLVAILAGDAVKIFFSKFPITAKIFTRLPRSSYLTRIVHVHLVRANNLYARLLRLHHAIISGSVRPYACCRGR